MDKNNIMVSSCREKVLEVWMGKKQIDATYRNLLKCVAGKDHDVAETICGLEIFKEGPPQQQAAANLPDPSQAASLPPVLAPQGRMGPWNQPVYQSQQVHQQQTGIGLH